MAKVIAFESSFPCGAFEPFVPAGSERRHCAPEAHRWSERFALDLSGLPRALPAVRCAACPAILVEEVPHADAL
jgi:hypothetical protein